MEEKKGQTWVVFFKKTPIDKNIVFFSSSVNIQAIKTYLSKWNTENVMEK